MKILHCAPIDIQISHKLLYAGTERILFYLNKGLHLRGHDSVVVAPQNSELGGFGTLMGSVEKHLWVGNGLSREIVRSDKIYEQHYQMVLKVADEFGVDIMHDHPGQFLALSQSYSLKNDRKNVPLVVTIHSPPSAQYEEPSQKTSDKYSRLIDMKRRGFPIHILGISDSHRREHEDIGLEMDGFVYNGIDLDLFPLVEDKQDYLLWLGRISGIKGTDLAVQIAKRMGKPLIIAGEVHDPYKQVFETRVKPFITQTISDGESRDSIIKRISLEEMVIGAGEILFLGPVDDRQKSILYSNALATLQPNRWKEPFGLVVVESMACGTPVIVTDRGALPELVVDGQTGFVVSTNGEDDLDETIIKGSIEALTQISEISPKECRKHVERNFSLEIMTQGYLDFYEKILGH